MISTATSQERVLLVSVDATAARGQWPTTDSMAELAALAYSAGANVVGKVVQRLPQPTKLTYIGKGKLDELLALKEDLNYDTIVVDGELTATQQQNLEDYLHAKVIDRVALILEIFARRARTHEGKLQVELAQNEYNLSHLAGKWHHLERLGGGIGTRGPGESQLETDRRLIRQKITRLRKQLEDVRRGRALHRQRRMRTGILVVALVGYTNTGKSTLLNALSGANVAAKDQLFSTLDPTTRKLVLPDGRTVLLTDTVGFIRTLPAALMAAFKATLEELNEANLLIHVVDVTSHNVTGQTAAVEGILRDLNLHEKPRITVLNKVDLALDNKQSWTEEKALELIQEKCGPADANTVLVSAAKKWGFKKLLETISEVLDSTTAGQPGHGQESHDEV